MKIIKTLVIVSLAILTGCKDNDKLETGPEQLTKEVLSGFVQKGPFINGTSITVSELDESFVQSGNTFTTQIIDNSGNFELKDITLGSPFIHLRADGFYFDEVIGEKSSAQLTLFALSDITSKDQININILTHLEKGRVEFLLSQGVEFNLAKDSAQHELLSAFGINNQNIGNSEDLDISINDSGNAILIAISIILQANNSVADLTELLANINTDFRQDGILNSESIKSKLFNAAQNLNLEQIRTNLVNRYADLGLNVSIPNFESIIEQYLAAQNPFGIETEVYNVSCKGLNNGSINITINGGNEPLTYQWSNGASAEDIDNLAAGYYSVVITDANGYTIKKTHIIVSEPEELEISFSVNHVSSFGGSDGSVLLAVSGGTEPYSYEWSNNQNSDYIQGLIEGEYEVVITDANSCSITSKAMVYTTFLDDRDNEKYKTVKIGNQIWFAENIRTTLDREGNTIERQCMDNDSDCSNYGGVYSKDIAQLICPVGWHVSTDADWKELESYLGMSSNDVNGLDYFRGNIASKLLEGGSTNLNIQLSGFRFIQEPSGTIYYLYKGTQSFFWTDQISGDIGLVRLFENTESGIMRRYRGGTGEVIQGSCRCVKD